MQIYRMSCLMHSQSSAYSSLFSATECCEVLTFLSSTEISNRTNNVKNRFSSRNVQPFFCNSVLDYYYLFVSDIVRFAIVNDFIVISVLKQICEFICLCCSCLYTNIFLIPEFRVGGKIILNHEVLLPHLDFLSFIYDFRSQTITNIIFK